MNRERPYRPFEKNHLDALSRATDPGKEALEQLAFELETSDIARKAFGAELVRLRALRDACHNTRGRLPQMVSEKLANCPKAKSFDHLVALAEANREPQPELDLVR